MAARSTIILSDLHSGADESLLSVLKTDGQVDPTAVSGTTAAFGDAMRATLTHLSGEEPHDLVILGDALDMSLAPTHVAAGVFRGFMSRLPTQMLSGRISFVPGNHDHKLWTAQRFASGPGAPDDPAHWAHVTPAFADHATLPGCATINALMPADASKVVTFYPDQGLGPVTQGGETRAVVLHHGHFIESVYRLMTRFLVLLSGEAPPPVTAEMLESVNSTWIDFGWSSFGDTGPLAQQIALAEEMLVTGGGAYKMQDRLAEALARSLQASLPFPRQARITDTLKQLSHGLIDALIGRYSELERFSYTEALSRSSRQTLSEYVDQVVAGQMRQELSTDPADMRLTFIFGHTHKPFADQIVCDQFTRPVSVYNTGGWVLDTALLSSVEGAAIAFVDGEMNTALLTLYSLGGNGLLQAASVSSADAVADDRNPMLVELTRAVTAAEGEWGAFREAVQSDLEAKQAMYLQRAGTGKRLGGAA